MMESIGAPLSEAKTSKAYVILPPTYSSLAELSFSASTTNIVKNTTLPTFLHSAKYHAKQAGLATGKQLLEHCQHVADQCPVIWKYIRKSDLSVVLPEDADEVFDFTTLDASDYEIKLVCRYWANAMANVLNNLDIAIRLAIKQQTRLALCLFEVAEKRKSVKMAYSILIHTEELKHTSTPRESFIEFANEFAKFIETTTASQISASVLYTWLEMSSDGINHMSWLASMLRRVPDITIQAWFAQLSLVGPWMFQLFTPMIDEWRELGIDMSRSPQQAFANRIPKIEQTPLSKDEVAVALEALVQLHSGEEPDSLPLLDDIIKRRTGYDMVALSAIFDSVIEFKGGGDGDVLIEGRPIMEIQKDIDIAQKKYDNVVAALREFETDTMFIDPKAPKIKLFTDYIEDNLNALDNADLERRRLMYMSTVSSTVFLSWVQMIVDSFEKRIILEKLLDELKLPENTKRQGTKSLTNSVRQLDGRIERALEHLHQEASIRLGNKYNKERLDSFLEWYTDEDALTMKRRKEDEYVKQVSSRFGPYEQVEDLLFYVNDVIKYIQEQKLLFLALEAHESRISFRRAILTFLILIMFGVGLFSLISYMTPSIPIIETESASLKAAANTSVGWFWDSRIVSAVRTSVSRRLQNAGWMRYDFSRLEPTTLMYAAVTSAPGFMLDLLFAKIILSAAVATSLLFYGVSTVGAYSAIAYVFDDNANEVWQQQTQILARDFKQQQQMFLIMAGQVINEISEHRNQAITLCLQGVQLAGGGGIAGFIGAAASFGMIGTRNNVSPKLIDWIHNRQNPSATQSIVRRMSAPDPLEITGPRVQDVTDQTLAVVPYTEEL